MSNNSTSFNCSISSYNTLTLCINHPTSSAPSSLLASLLAWLSLVYYPMTAYYEPFTLFFGVLNNVLILVVVLFGRYFRDQRSSASTARLYYIAFAVADIGCVTAIPLLRVVGDGLYTITNGAVYLFLDEFSNDWCRAWRGLFHTSEGFLGWSLVLFNVERLVALQWPFFARTFVTPGRVLAALCTLFSTCALLSLLAIPIYQIAPTKASRVGITCQGITTTTSALGLLVSFALGFGSIGIPTLFYLILMLLLVYKVKSTQKGHSGLSHQSTASSSSSSSSSSELLAVIVTISAVSFVFYFPFAFTWSVLTGLGSVLSSDWSSLLQLLRRFFLECSEIVHSLNLFVYLYHVRAFRREFARMFGCTANACRRVSLQTSTKDATMASTTK